MPADDRPATDRSNDWVTSVVGLLDRTVGSVRSIATEPAIMIVRGLVYGVLGAVFALFALALLAVALVRAVVLITGERVWLAHLIVGSVFLFAGLALWSRRHPKPT